MKNSSIKNGITTGIVFGIITTLVFLIGFAEIAAQLVSKVLSDASFSKNPAYIYFAVYMALMALWSGSLSAKTEFKRTGDLGKALLSSTTTGVVAGLFSLVLALIFGTLLQNQIDVRKYLVSVSPQSIKLFLFDQTAVLGGVLEFILSVIGAYLGAYLYHFFTVNGYVLKAKASISSNFQNAATSDATKKVTSDPKFKIFVYLLIAFALIYIPQNWGSYWNYVFGTVGIYVLLGIGLNMITGWAGQLVIGYSFFFAVGAYTFAIFTSPEPHNLMWNFWIATGLGILAAALSGLFLGLPILNLRGDYLAIVTLGLGEIIRILLKSDMLTEFTGGPRGLQKVAGPTLFGKPFNSDIDFMYLIIVAVLVVSFLAHRLQNSRTGKAWYAINLDETVARATGVSSYGSKLLALTISASIAGLAGAIFASRNQFTGPDDHTLMVSINVICLIIVGGIGNIPGVFLGAFALKGLPEILREIENYRMLVFGVLLIVMMRIRPEGFIPLRRPALEKFVKPSTEKEGGAQ